MDAGQKEFLEEKGFDVDGTMKRFLNTPDNMQYGSQLP